MPETVLDPHKTFTRYMASGYGHQPAQGVDRDANIIRGVSVCTMGEAKGHGVHLDSEFIDTVSRLGAEKKMGVKCRFGHPNMCNEALGTHVGWFKNFSREGDQVRADLHISETADDSPKGELGSYLLKMAEKEDGAFGTSIVFTPGNLYRRGKDGQKVQYNVEYKEWGVDAWYTDETGHRLSEDEIDEAELSDEMYVECESLHACDAVDEPAANEGLFSAEYYGQGELAAQLSEFLDLHPQIAQFAESNPDLVNQFMSRYSANSLSKNNNNQEEKMPDNEQKEVEEVVTEPASFEATPAEPESAEPAPEVEPEAEPEALSEENDLSDLQKAVAEFGAEIATQAFGAGGGYAEAKDLYFAALKAENESLKASKGESGVDPVVMGEGDDAPRKVWKNI